LNLFHLVTQEGERKYFLNILKRWTGEMDSMEIKHQLNKVYTAKVRVLKSIRTLLGLEAMDVASEIGISTVAFCNLENARYFKHLHKLEDYYFRKHNITPEMVALLMSINIEIKRGLN
jgi:hypothetical protein